MGDRLTQFIQERCRANPAMKTKATVLRDLYILYRQRTDLVFTISAAAFNKAMAQQFPEFPRSRSGDGFYFCGLELLPTPDSTQFTVATKPMRPKPSQTYEEYQREYRKTRAEQLRLRQHTKYEGERQVREALMASVVHSADEWRAVKSMKLIRWVFVDSRSGEVDVPATIAQTRAAIEAWHQQVQEQQTAAKLELKQRFEAEGGDAAAAAAAHLEDVKVLRSDFPECDPLLTYCTQTVAIPDADWGSGAPDFKDEHAESLRQKVATMTEELERLRALPLPAELDQRIPHKLRIYQLETELRLATNELQILG